VCRLTVGANDGAGVRDNRINHKTMIEYKCVGLVLKQLPK